MGAFRRMRWYEWLSLDLGVFLAIIFGGPYETVPTWAAVLLGIGYLGTALPMCVFFLAFVMGAFD